MAGQMETSNKYEVILGGTMIENGDDSMEKLSIVKFYKNLKQSFNRIKLSNEVNEDFALVKTPTLFNRWWTAALAASLAETVTLPLDVAKTQLQLTKHEAMFHPKHQAKSVLTMTDHFQRIRQTHGFIGLYSGWFPAIYRQAVSGGISIGFYQDIKQIVCGKNVSREEIPMYKKFLAGAISGCIGQIVAMPFDVIKVKLQADIGKTMLDVGPKKHREFKGSMDAIMHTKARHGYKGFFNGLTAAMFRSSVMVGCGLATYDHIKSYLLEAGWHSDLPTTHFACSLFSSVASTFVSVPFDVMKTRMIMNKYDHLYQCFNMTIRREGVMAIYKGFLPTLYRLAPWQIIFFTTYERISIFVYGYSFRTST